MSALEEGDCEHIRMAAYEWRVRISGGDLERAERDVFEAWLTADPRHADAYDRATTVWAAYGALNRQNVDAALFEPNAADRVREIAGGFGGAADWTVRGFAVAGGAFAVLVLAVAAALFGGPGAPPRDLADNPIVAFETAVGEMREVTLTDRSVLTLGPSTRVHVAVSADRRRIDLINGAAVFAVAPDASRPFTVHADQFVARAVGTVFDVRHNGGVVRLSVLEGVVDAAHPVVVNNKPAGVFAQERLVKGQRIAAVADEGLSPVQPFEERTFASWRTGRMRYVGAPLSEIIADANRYAERPIEIDATLAGVETVKVTFSFDAADIDGMLGALPALFPVAIDRSDAQAIVIRAK
ncbi:MAG: FecR domain-containing protein [Pseudomonadota bacterium]